MIDIHDKSLDLKIIAHLICKKDLLAVSYRLKLLKYGQTRTYYFV